MSYWADIEAAIAAWLQQTSGLPAGKVMWSNQRMAFPVRPYATLKRTSVTDLGPVGGEVVYSVAVEAVTSWAPATDYAVGAERKSDGHVYVCRTAGRSGASAPTGIGSTIQDGTAVWDYARDVDVVTASVTHRFEMVVSVQVYASATVGDAQRTVTSASGERTAADYLNDARIALSLPSTLEAFDAKNIAAISASQVRDLPDDASGTWLSRAQMDVTFSCVKTLREERKTIDRVIGELESTSPGGGKTTIAFDVRIPTA